MSIRDPMNSDSPIYDPDDNYLSMRLYHGGLLKWIPSTEYLGGNLTVYDYFDMDSITFESMHLKTRALGHCDNNCFYFRIPGKSLDTGLVLVKGYEDVEKMKHWGKQNNSRIDVYVSHGEREAFMLVDAYERLCPEDYDRHDSNGVGDESDDLDDHDFVDSDYSMSEDDDKAFAANVDVGAEWAGRIRDGLGLEHRGGENEDESQKTDSENEDSDDFSSIPDIDAETDHVQRKRKHDFAWYKDSDDPKWDVGMLFKDHKQIRAAITKHSYSQGRAVRFEKSEADRVRAVCEAPCPWFMFASLNWDKTFQVKRVGPDHTCVRKQNKLPLIHSGFLAAKYLNDFRMNPSWSIPAFHKKVIQDLQIDFKAHVLRRAKSACLKRINGVDGEQYAKLWDYKVELLKRNPHSTVVLEFEEGCPGVFKRMYVCFGGVKHGFKIGCRKVIGLDGTHLKNQFKGQLLCAVGVDPNNCMYPICYAVVEVENQDTWGWFLKLFVSDFEMDQGLGWVVISDRQKGPINVVSNLLPAAEHRYCVRHMHNNFKQKYRGRSLKDKMWACARATNVEAFSKAMEVVKCESGGAFEWLNAVPKQHWNRAHFGTDVKCDILLNNMCESFNKSILFAREQGILVMLEMIRDYLMQRLQTKRDKSFGWDDDDFTPKIKKLVDKYKKWSGGCFAAYAGYNQFEVTTVNGSKFAVDLNKHSCGCRRWDISGIPCHHAIASINKLSQKVEDYVDGCYRVRTYRKCYSGIIYPMNGEGQWEKHDYLIKPPNIKKQPGRPKRKRKQEPLEGPVTVEEEGVKILTRKNQMSIRCKLCGIIGHNKRTCTKKNEVVGSSSNNPQNEVESREGTTDNNGDREEGTGGVENDGGEEGNGGGEGNGGEEGNGEGAVENEADNEDLPEVIVNDREDGNRERDDGPLEMTLDDDAPTLTQPTQQEGPHEGLQNSTAVVDNYNLKGKGKMVEDADDEEPPVELAARKIQAFRRAGNMAHKFIEAERWEAMMYDLRAAREKMEARAAFPETVMSDSADHEESLQGKIKKMKGKDTSTQVSVRRSGRLMKPRPVELQFTNTPETALEIDDEAHDGNDGQRRKTHKLKAPPTYTGPSLIGPPSKPQLVDINTTVGGVNVKAKGFKKGGKAVVTKEALARALDEAKRNMQKQDKTMQLPEKESRK